MDAASADSGSTAGGQRLIQTAPLLSRDDMIILLKYTEVSQLAHTFIPSTRRTETGGSP